MFCPSCGKDIPDHSTFCLVCGKPIQVIASHAEQPREAVKEELSPPKKRWSVVTKIAIVALIVVAVYMIVDRPSHVLTADDKARMTEEARLFQATYVPRIEKLTSGQFPVKAGQIHFIRFNIDTTKMNDVQVVGRFEAAGGNNDIEAVITDGDGFENWKNGHQANVLYTSQGKTTVGNIDTPITTSGSYVLAFSNRFSTFTDKYVAGDIELRYKVKQLPVAYR